MQNQTNPKTSPLPRLTPAFFSWAAVDLVAVLIVALGAAYLIEGRASLLPGLPANTLQAWICIVLGLVAVLIAAVKMMVEVMHSNTRRDPAANDSHFS
jgi:hypothetical protein